MENDVTKTDANKYINITITTENKERIHMHKNSVLKTKFKTKTKKLKLGMGFYRVNYNYLITEIITQKEEKKWCIQPQIISALRTERNVAHCTTLHENWKPRSRRWAEMLALKKLPSGNLDKSTLGCRLCKKEFAHQRSTSSLRYRLTAKHPAAS